MCVFIENKIKTNVTHTLKKMGEKRSTPAGKCMGTYDSASACVSASYAAASHVSARGRWWHSPRSYRCHDPMNCLPSAFVVDNIWQAWEICIFLRISHESHHPLKNTPSFLSKLKKKHTPKSSIYQLQRMVLEHFCEASRQIFTRLRRIKITNKINKTHLKSCTF